MAYAPFNINGLAAWLILARLLFRVVFHWILTVRTPIGRKARPNIPSRGPLLIRAKPGDLARASVKRVPRMIGVAGGKPVLADQGALEPANPIWCTGFHPGFSWIDLPGFGRVREPAHQRGVVSSVPGLYLVGLEFLYHGVSKDAKCIASTIATRMREQAGPAVSSAKIKSPWKRHARTSDLAV